MAVFNPNVPTTNDPNYLGYSKGVEAGRADLSSATLFKNIAEIGSSALEATDDLFKGYIRKDVQASVDRIQSAAGVDEAVNKVAQDGTLYPKNPQGVLVMDDASIGDEGVSNVRGAPADVMRVGQTLQSAKMAYEAGQLSKSYYDTQLETESRRLRAQLPGYRDVIDATFQKITGVIPANALVADIRSDLDAAARSQAQGANSIDKYIMSHNKYLSPEEFSHSQTGRRSKEDTLALIQARTFDEHNVAEDTKRINNTKGSRDLIEKQTDDQTLIYANKKYQESIGLLLSDKEVQPLIEAFRRGEKLSANDRIRLEQKMITFTKEQTEQWSDFLNKSRDTSARVASGGTELEPTRTLATMLGSTNYDKQVQGFNKRLGDFFGDVRAAKTGVMDLAATSNKMSKDVGLNEIFAVAGDLPAIFAAGQEGKGGELFVDALNKDPNLFAKPIAASVVALNKLALKAQEEKTEGEKKATASTRDSALLFKDAKGLSVQEKEQAYRHLMQYDIQNMSNKKITGDDLAVLTDKAISNPSRTLISEVGNPKDRRDWFMKMTSSEVTQNLERIKDSHPTTYAKYKDFLMHEGAQLLGPTSSTVQSGLTSNSKDFTLNFDPKSNRLLFDTTRKNIDMPTAGMGQAGNSAVRTVREAVIDINKLLDRWDPVFARDGKKMDTETTLQIMRESFAINPKAVKDMTGPEMIHKIILKGLEKVKDMTTSEETIGEALRRPIIPSGTPAQSNRNLSSSNIQNITTDDIPDGMSAKDFLKLLKERDRQGK